jgi:hypothetical protein
MELEHEAASGQADIGPFRFRQFRGRLSTDHDLAFAGCIEQAQKIEQGRFARSRRPGNGDEFAPVHREINAVDEGVRNIALDAADQLLRLQSDLGHDAPLMMSTGCTRVALRAGK